MMRLKILRQYVWNARYDGSVIGSVLEQGNGALSKRALKNFLDLKNRKLTT
jgi:hypothetical protein